MTVRKWIIFREKYDKHFNANSVIITSKNISSYCPRLHNG